ncbi:MAG: ParB/RepB/Spo0J family partition protein [Clostridia bacterium]
MALQKKGLGRGLDALLDPYIMETSEEQKQSVLTVSVHDIDTNREQPRKQFDEESLKELSASIKTHGIVQPLIVKERNGRYMIIAGERRFRAARMAGLASVPVLVADYDEAQIHEVSLIENIQREDLNPVEEAAAIRFLMQQHDMTQEEVSSRIGKSRPAVANSLRLLQLPEYVMDMLKDGTLSAGHGRALAGLSDATLMEKIVDETVRLNYSVRTLESRIKNLSVEKPRKEKKTEAVISSDLKHAEETFRERLGTKVKITGTETSGKILIEYYSHEDLERVYERIHGE